MLSSLFDLSDSDSFAFDFDAEVTNSMSMKSEAVDSRRETIIATQEFNVDASPDPNRATITFLPFGDE
jgi:hypothetical protein